MAEPLRQKMPKNHGFSKAELKRYLDYIGSLGSVQIHGCILCGAEAEVAHIKFGEPCDSVICEDGYVETPVGPGDRKCAHCLGTEWRFGKIHGLRQHRWSINLCPAEHRLYKRCQHDGSEQKFWQERGIDILAVAKHLQEIYDEHGMPAALMVAAEYLGEV